MANGEALTRQTSGATGTLFYKGTSFLAYVLTSVTSYYSEGGAVTAPFYQATSNFGRNTTLIIGTHGLGVAGSQPNGYTYINGNRFRSGNAIYPSTDGYTTQGFAEKGINFTSTDNRTISLVNRSNQNLGNDAGINY